MCVCVCITDDTASTNIYDQNLQIVIVVDQENKSQLLSFGTLIDKTTNGFYEYFNALKNLHHRSPRIFVVDRSYPQLMALKMVYPESIIVFCHIHIRRDLEKYFKIEDDIIKYWQIMNKDIRNAKDLVEIIEKRISESQNFHGREALMELLNTQEHWNPLLLIQKGCFMNWNTNRAEGFFGTFKQNYGYKRVTLTKLFKNLMTNAKLMLVQSLNSQKQTINFYNEFPCFIKDDISYIGKLALDIISHEYNEYLNFNDNFPYCALCYLRTVYPEFALPCRHTFQNMNIPLSKSILNIRYLRYDNKPLLDENCQIEQTIHIEQSWEYSDLMAKISPYASIANKSDSVKKIFSETIARLEETKTLGNESMRYSPT